ncbi:hypothetical protein N7447_009233 [Penicillium robsamsonii]|uniref:uncharacterized protein n=1 Tax=Penicillium robsamsonii TaxID=1792511 RepID=UPI002549834F|nr:uncharacterized protein N7447_009233 [Penicillium robsamsonii]KAJ5817000.1 hypothetical protein N7447_009233 [Penicillium robsamsonii]
MSHPILIIGAGLGGLCLAQGLKKRNIPFKIFEQDERHDLRTQGYRLRVSTEGIYALRDTLSPEIYALFENTCAETVIGGVRLKPDGTPLGGTGPPRPRGSALFPEPQTVDRNTFREVLLTGLDEHVFFGKSFDHYTVSDGDTIAFFGDGSKETGALIVGADGVRSRVRKQYIPDFKGIDTGMRIIFGKTPLTPKFLAKFPEVYHRGMSLITDPDDESRTSLLFESIRFPHAEKVSKPQLPDPYVYWVLITHHSNISSSYGMPWQLSPEKSAELARQVTKSWHPDLKVLFEMQDEAQTSTRWMLSASPELASWEPSPQVTLLGDAIHPMPPTGAMGANTALRDAADLARRLSTAVNSQTLGRQVIEEYESELRDSAKTAIVLSWQGGVRGFNLRPADECEKILL